MKKVTEKQRRFVDFYIELGNATEAYKKAGYKWNTDNQAAVSSSKLLRNAKVQKAVRNRVQELADAKKADLDEILTYLTSVMRGEQKDELLVVEGCGEGCSSAKRYEVRVQTKDRLNAAKELIKRFPRNLDTQEQRLRLKTLTAEIQESEQQGEDSVQIIDDLDGKNDCST